jgi:hypothetical protein
VGCTKSNTTGVTSGAEIHIVVVEQENLAKDVVLGLVTLPIGGGAVALVRGHN